MTVDNQKQQQKEEEEELVCSDSEPDRSPIPTKQKLIINNNNNLNKHSISHAIAHLRHQPIKNSLPSSSSSSGSSITLLHNKPTSRSNSFNNNRKSSSGSSNQSLEILKINYSTLLRLKSCPACRNQWTTYKSPQSKLNHIQKCAQQEFIQPKYITQRIQSILQQQDLDSNQSTSLLERHSSNQNLISTSETIPISQPSSSSPQIQQPPYQKNKKQNDSIALSPLSNQPSINTAPKTSCSTHHSSSSSSSSSSSLVIKSSGLSKIHRQTLDRNSQVVTKNHSSTPYSLWNLASCHDDFQYDRCNPHSSHLHHPSQSHSDLGFDDRENKSRDSHAEGNNESEEEVQLKQISSKLGRLRIAQNSCGEQVEEDRESDQSSCDSYKVMPRYEEWTHNELKNESERLGFDDGSDLSVDALIDRAQFCWKFQFDVSDFHLPRRARTRPHPINHNHDNDHQQFDSNESRSSAQEFDVYDDDIEWVNNLLNPEDLQDPYSYQNESEPESDFNKNIHKKVKSQLTPTTAHHRHHHYSPKQAKRPIFETFSKVQLENEHSRLKQLLIDSFDELTKQNKLKKENIDLDKVPKTKPGLINKLIKLWDLIHRHQDHNSNDDDDNDDDLDGEEHEDEKYLRLNSKENLLAGKKFKIKIVKEKLSNLELNRLMLNMFHQSEQELYLRILRYEPIKLSIIGEKVEKELKREFELEFDKKTRVEVYQDEDEDEDELRNSSENQEELEDQVQTIELDKLTNEKQKQKKKQKKKGKAKGKSSSEKIRIILVKKRVLSVEVLVKWLDLQAISYFVIDPTITRKLGHY